MVDHAGGLGELRDIEKEMDTRAVRRQIWQDVAIGCAWG